MINKEALTKVRNLIRRHKKQFSYNYFFNSDFLFGHYLKHKNHCGTIGCVAGWTCIAFPKLTRQKERYVGSCYHEASEIATSILGLNKKEEQFLFFDFSDLASVDDALARIKWLLEDKEIDNYNFRKETWFTTEIERNLSIPDLEILNRFEEKAKNNLENQCI